MHDVTLSTTHRWQLALRQLVNYQIGLAVWMDEVAKHMHRRLGFICELASAMHQMGCTKTGTYLMSMDHFL